MASHDNKISKLDLKTWKDALKAENCVRVRELLWKKAKELSPVAFKLLKEGWYEVKSKRASVWKGRTALHVAARRGDVQLVRDILRDIVCPLISRESKEHAGISLTDLDHLLEVTDDDYDLDALGMAIVNGNKQIANLLQDASVKCDWNPYEISRDAFVDNGVSDDKDNAVLARTLTGVTKEVSCEVSQSSTENDAIADDVVSADEVLAQELSRLTEEVLSEVCQSSTENVLSADEVLAQELSRLTKEVLSEVCQSSTENVKYIKQLYKEDCDFNFIDVKVDMHLFFHFTFSTWTMSGTKAVDRVKVMEEIQAEIIFRAKDNKKLLNYLLVTLEDGQGRTALHVAVDSGKVRMFLTAIDSVLGTGDDTKVYLNVRDSANRTPLYRAAAKKLSYAVEDLLDDKRTDINAKIVYDAHKWGKGLDIDKLSWKNGFRSDCVYVPEEKLTRKGFNNPNNSQAGPGPDLIPLEKTSSTALHVAIIHKHEDIVKKILEAISTRFVDGHFASTCPNCRRHYTWPILTALQGDCKTYQQSAVQTMQLTVLVGNIPILQQLLEAEDEWKKPRYFSGLTEADSPTFLLAAAMGNPGMIKAFLDSKQGEFDYNVQDAFKNTALHHALKGKHVQFYPHLVDFVGCHHVYSSRWDNDEYLSDWLSNPQEKQLVQSQLEKTNKAGLEDRYGQRRGSINLLLEAGIDIWAENDQRRTAAPDPNAPKDFVEWWYEKVSVETKQEQTKLNDAANAISVVAALVATASYVGPLQPPLGYNEESLQVNILAVRIFVLCNSISFYFALAAIMLALLPSLPLQKESMFRELKQTGILVAFAVTCLFPSIICVLVAFAAGYISVIPDHGLSHNGLIVATTIVGGFVCLLVMVWFLDRLRKVLKDRLKGYHLSQVMRKLQERLQKTCGY